MKKNTILLLAMSVLLATGCDDFLSKTPDNRAQLDSEDKVAELLVTAYPEANYSLFCEAMSDNAQDNFGASQDVRNADAYFWRDGAATWQDSPENYWNACYTAIAATNHALRAIERSDDPAAYDAQKGEALVARAYSHFMLVNLFAHTYDVKTAATDPGIPYVTEPETVSLKTYERQTVAYVYEMIEKDLTEGLPLINDQAYMTNSSATGVEKYHFTKAAAHAFATRYYLFKKEYDKVIEHADLAFAGQDPVSLLRPWNTTYKTYSATDLAVEYTKSDDKSNLLICETASEWARSFNALRYSTGTAVYQQLYLLPNPSGGLYAYSFLRTSMGVFFINKYREHFVRVGTNATTGYPYTIIPLFTAEEVLLNRAEAYAMQVKFHDALTDMNTFVSTRIVDYDPDVYNVTYNKLYNLYQESNNQKAIVLGILDLRRIEFLHEGLRWFDILRHKIPVVHTTVDGEVMELGPEDPRRILQIPREAISVGGLEPNPR